MTDYTTDCPPGQEIGPAIENTHPYCVPADEPLPDPTSVPIYLPVDPGPELGPPQAVYPSPLPLDIPSELANTGTDDWMQWAIAALILIIAGVALWIGDNKGP